LDVIVVRTGQPRERPREAPLPEAAILRAVGRSPRAPGRRAGRFALLRLGGERRDPAVRWIHDKRRLAGLHHLRAPIPPELVVRASHVGAAIRPLVLCAGTVTTIAVLDL